MEKDFKSNLKPPNSKKRKRSQEEETEKTRSGSLSNSLENNFDMNVNVDFPINSPPSTFPQTDPYSPTSLVNINTFCDSFDSFEMQEVSPFFPNENSSNSSKKINLNTEEEIIEEELNNVSVPGSAGSTEINRNKGTVIYSIFGEDDSGSYYNFLPKLKVQLEGLKFDEGCTWVKKNGGMKLVANLIGNRENQNVNQILNGLSFYVVGCGLPQTSMSKNNYNFFQCLVNSNKKEEGIVLSKDLEGKNVIDVLKKEIIGYSLMLNIKINTGTNVSGHWRFLLGYRFGLLFDNILYLSVPFKVLSRKPSKKRKKKKQESKYKLVNLQLRNNRFLCYLYIFDVGGNKRVVEAPELNKKNVISINQNKKLGFIQISTNGIVISPNTNWKGTIFLNKQTIHLIYDEDTVSNIVATIGNSTSIKILNKPKWSVIFKNKGKIVQSYFTSNSVIIGRNSMFVPKDLDQEEKARISKIHLKVDTWTWNKMNILTVTDCSKNGTKISLPLRAFFFEGVKYSVKFNSLTGEDSQTYKFHFLYSTIRL